MVEVVKVKVGFLTMLLMMQVWYVSEVGFGEL